MDLITDPDEALLNSRLVGIKLTLLSLRLMDNWARLFGDPDAAAIGMAIVATGAERLLRTDLDDDLKSLSRPMPTEALTGCNISSIALATGWNRETARRRVNRFVAEGMFVRDRGAIRLAPGFAQQAVTSSTVDEQLEELRRTVNALLRMGVLTVKPAHR